jgi:uncharacterized protein with HEPN domain
VSAQARKYLWDIAQAAELIARFTAERGFDDYLADAMLRAAVERQFTIVGEATVTLRRLDPALAAAIPDLAKIIAFRNILVHGYATVDNHVVWGIVERQLAVLRSTVERLIRDIDSKGAPNSPGGTV